MRILILGGTGMLGHRLWQDFSGEFKETYTTIRNRDRLGSKANLFDDPRVINSVDANRLDELKGVMKCIRPDFILNCVGVTKRKKECADPLYATRINSMLPHELVRWGRENHATVINFSTDCVFDGFKGNYTESCTTNASDLYGKTKALGEIQGEHALTIRSSFIGPELCGGTELFEWFRAQKGAVKGFTHAIYTGLTTFELSRVVRNILVNYPDANGLYHLSSSPISKYALLKLIKEKMNLDMDLIADGQVRCDRSLNSERFQTFFTYTPPTWEAMIEELAQLV